jgi:3',5'-cyclic AMP phosphodiesterase CpdA
MDSLATFRSPVVSLWQSAINEVLARQHDAQPQTLGDELPPSTADAPIMRESAAAAQALLSGQLVSQPGVLGVSAGDCGQLYLQLVLARARGDTQAIARLESEITFSHCDPLWGLVLAEYEKFRIFGSGQIPYRRHHAMTDFVLDLPKNDTTKPVTIALIADWGTGMEPARQVLTVVGQQKPDVLIHLGDIYYSGTSREVQERFLAICQRTPGLHIPTFTLAGNHDMYSGGAGYYWLLDQLGQPASYFCLRNADWQLLAMDTGLHDNDPGTVVSNLTYLDEQELAWQRDKIANAGGRKTILLSHHQLFSAANSVGTTDDGKPLAVNPHLYSAFADVLDQVQLWIWGHEHNMIVFDEYAGLARGRCIGSAAVPTLLVENPYTPDPTLVLPAGQSQPPIMDPRVRLGDNGKFYNHGYALLTLSGPTATIAYYQVAGDGSSALLFEEPIPAV